MLNNVKALLVKWFPATEAAERYRHRQRILGLINNNRITANAIERALLTGTYGDARPFMCEALLKVPGLDIDEAFNARRRVMAEIHPHWFLMDMLEQEGTLDRDACEFEMRIVCSLWYWGFIRKLRKEAADIHTAHICN